MSRLAKKPIQIPEGVKVEVKDRAIDFNGKQGNLSVPILEFIKVELKDNQISVSPLSNNKQARANWGTVASLAKNAVVGVSQGFTKSLEVHGVGYRVNTEGDTLILNVGFSHPVKFRSPEGIKINIEKNIITISGIDKNLVGQTAAGIRKIKKPEPYKGKGIRYTDEIIRRKVGKKAAGTGAA